MKSDESEKLEAEGGDWRGYKKGKSKGSKRQNKLKVMREKQLKLSDKRGQ